MNKMKVFAVAAMMLASCLMAQQPVQPKQDSSRAPVMMKLNREVMRDSSHRGPEGRMPATLRGARHRQHEGGQQGRKRVMKAAELKYNADGIETTIVKAFPEVKKTKKGEKWTEVYNEKGKLLGYVVYSKPASDSIKGFNGETPVLISFDKKKIIRGVYALPNVETPGFEKRVADAGFYNLWNGLTVKQARQKKVDTVSGATFTSRAIALSVQAALEQL